MPIAIHHQAVEAGRTRDKGCIADVGNALPVSSQVKRRSLFLCIKPLFDRMLQAVLRAVASLLAWAPSGQDLVAETLKKRFLSCSHILHDALFRVGHDGGASASDPKKRSRFLHKLLLHYAREQAQQRNPSLFSS